MTRLLLTLLFVAIAAGCSSPIAPELNPRVVIVVHDADSGRFLADARVEVIGTQIRYATGQRGYLEVDVPAGAQRICAWLGGYEPGCIDVSVVHGSLFYVRLRQLGL